MNLQLGAGTLLVDPASSHRNYPEGPYTLPMDPYFGFGDLIP